MKQSKRSRFLGLLGFWTSPIIRYSIEHNLLETGSVPRTLCSLEYWKIDEVQKPSVLQSQYISLSMMIRMINNMRFDILWDVTSVQFGRQVPTLKPAIPIFKVEQQADRIKVIRPGEYSPLQGTDTSIVGPLSFPLWDVVALETPTNTYHHFLCLCGWSVGPEKGRICTVDN
jgi:hypothetical protein